MKLCQAVGAVLKEDPGAGGSEFTWEGTPEEVSSAHVGVHEGGGLRNAGSGIGSEGYRKNATPGGAVMSESVGSSVSLKHGFMDSYVGGADGYDSSFLVKRGALGEIYVFDKKTQESWDPDARTVRVMLDCSLSGEDKVSKATGLGWSHKYVDGEKDGASPGVLRLYYKSTGEISWEETAWRIPDDVDGHGDGNYYVCDRIVGGNGPQFVIRCGLERGFIDDWINNFVLFGVGLGRDEFLRSLVDFRYLKLMLLRGTVATVLDGHTNCACRVGAESHYWLGAGKCKKCTGDHDLTVGGDVGTCLSLFGGVVGCKVVSRPMANMGYVCDAMRRMVFLLMPALSPDVDLIVTYPIMRMLPFVKSAMRELVREMDLLSYEGVGRVLPPLIQALVYSRVNFVSNQELFINGIVVSGTRRPITEVIPSWWYEEGGREGGREVPPILSGPYDVNMERGMYCRRHNTVLCASMLSTMGGYDLLLNTGVSYRPLEDGHLPLVYHGAYGKYGLPGEGYPYLEKTGAWGSTKALRKEEGMGMRYHIDFGLYEREYEAAVAEGRDLEEVRKEIIGKWRVGVSWDGGY